MDPTASTDAVEKICTCPELNLGSLVVEPKAWSLTMIEFNSY
jgi:hypothetical protein